MTTNTNFSPKTVLPQLIHYFKWITIIGLVFFAMIVISTIFSIVSSDFQNFSFCFTNHCINNTLTAFSGAIKFMAGLVFILTSIATVGGIFIALMGYINNHETSTLNNHISHFTIFKDYINIEVMKRDRLDVSVLDIFRWYNLIFINSRLGSMVISDRYIDIIKEINIEITTSNIQSQKATEGSFYYRKHQYRMIEVVKSLGIVLEIYPRNDFYEVEGQLLALISSINNEFCSDERIPAIENRKYI
jgi:hypothetical protein